MNRQKYYWRFHQGLRLYEDQKYVDIWQLAVKAICIILFSQAYKLKVSIHRKISHVCVLFLYFKIKIVNVAYNNYFNNLITIIYMVDVCLNIFFDLWKNKIYISHYLCFWLDSASLINFVKKLSVKYYDQVTLTKYYINTFESTQSWWYD